MTSLGFSLPSIIPQLFHIHLSPCDSRYHSNVLELQTGCFVPEFNTLRTGDADLRFYVTTVQDG